MWILKSLGVGGGIVANYDKLTPIFTVGPWAVTNAVHKTNGDRVSLWEIDQEVLAKDMPDPAVQERYLKSCLTGVQKLKKLRHPHLLKILEIQEKLTDLAFAAEPISTSLPTLIGSLNNDDAAYISFQIAEVLQFLHQNAKIAHLGICPDAIFLDETLSVKLSNFNWAVDIAQNGTIDLPFDKYLCGPGYPELNYTAPEIVQGKLNCFPQCDVFSFALVFYECLSGKRLLNYKEKREYDIGRNPISSAGGVQAVYINLFKTCMHINPQMRPGFEQIMNDDAFSSMQMKILRYLDLLALKEQKDKFVFFKNLVKSVDSFSPIMARSKILPLLIAECKEDIRFAPVLLGSIFTASSKFNVSEFTENVFKKIAFLTTVTDPPQVSIALIQNLPLILEKTEQKYHAESVYPIIFKALQSNQEILHRECLKKLPLVIEKITESVIQQTLIPRLVELANTTKESSLVVSCIMSITICLGKSDNDQFLRTSLPKVYEAWRKNQSAKVALAMCEMIEKINASHKTMLSRGIPVAADITSNQVTEPYVQKRLCAWMIKVINDYKKSGRLDEAVEPEPEPVAKPNNNGAKPQSGFDDFSLPSTTTSSNGMNNFDFDFSTPAVKPKNDAGFGNSSAFSKPAAAKNETGFGDSSVFGSAPKNDAGFGNSSAFSKPAAARNETGFGDSSVFGSAPKNDNGFGNSSPFGEPSKPAPKNDTGFNPSFGASPKPEPKNDNGFGNSSPFGEPSKPAPKNDTGFNPSFGASPKPEPKNDTGFNPGFGTSPKPAPKNDTGFNPSFGASPKPNTGFNSGFGASPKPTPQRNDTGFNPGFDNSQRKSNDFNPFASPQKGNAFQPFGSPQQPKAGNDFQPFGNQQQGFGQSTQRPQRNVPGANQFGSGFSPKTTQQRSQQKGNDLLDLF